MPAISSRHAWFICVCDLSDMFLHELG
jgi:hypothetical protein